MYAQESQRPDAQRLIDCRRYRLCAFLETFYIVFVLTAWQQSSEFVFLFHPLNGIKIFYRTVFRRHCITTAPATYTIVAVISIWFLYSIAGWHVCPNSHGWTVSTFLHHQDNSL